MMHLLRCVELNAAGPSPKNSIVQNSNPICILNYGIGSKRAIIQPWCEARGRLPLTGSQRGVLLKMSSLFVHSMMQLSSQLAGACHARTNIIVCVHRFAKDCRLIGLDPKKRKIQESSPNTPVIDRPLWWIHANTGKLLLTLHNAQISVTIISTPVTLSLAAQMTRISSMGIHLFWRFGPFTGIARGQRFRVSRRSEHGAAGPTFITGNFCTICYSIVLRGFLWSTYLSQPPKLRDIEQLWRLASWQAACLSASQPPRHCQASHTTYR